MEKEIEKDNRKNFIINLAMLFLLGALVGMTIKTEALKKITIGYNDYLMKIDSQDYNINKMQTDLTQARNAMSKSQDNPGASELVDTEATTQNKN
jgi:hypothetical protein